MFCDIVHNEAIISLLELSTTTLAIVEQLFFKSERKFVQMSQRDRKCPVSQKCSLRIDH